MSKILISKIDFLDDRFRIVRSIREQVFVKEQGVDSELEYDQYEKSATHFLMLYKGDPVAVARKRKTDSGIKWERFAVLKDFRGLGLGKILALNLIQSDINSKHLIYLNSQIQAVPFYQSVGFIKVGQPFAEADIVHYKMVLRDD